MKKMLIRAVAIAIFATTLSAGAMSGKAKTSKDKNPNQPNAEEPSTPSSVDRQNSDLDEVQSEQNRNKSRRQQLIDRENKEWLHNLQGIYGG